MLNWKGPIWLLALHRTHQESHCGSEMHNLSFSRTWRCLVSFAVSGGTDTQVLLEAFTISLYYFYCYHNFCFNPTLGIFENITLLCSRIRIKLLRNCISNAIYFTSWRMQTQLLQAHHYCLNSSLAYFVGNTLKHFLNFATKRAFEPYILLIVTEYQCWPSDQLSFSSVLHSPPVIYQTLLCT